MSYFDLENQAFIATKWHHKYCSLHLQSFSIQREFHGKDLLTLQSIKGLDAKLNRAFTI